MKPPQFNDQASRRWIRRCAHHQASLLVEALNGFPVCLTPGLFFNRTDEEIMSDHDIETDILAKGLTAPRITLADIEALIIGTYCFTAAQGARAAIADDGAIGTGPLADAGPLGLLTICVLVLQNGFTVMGESACASPENFDAGLGKKIARDNAVNKLWPLLGYQLRDRLHGAVELRGSLETLTPDLPDVEKVSASVHDAWMESKRRQGVTTRKAEDGEELMAPYQGLSDKAKDLDRNSVRAVYAAIAAAQQDNGEQVNVG